MKVFERFIPPLGSKVWWKVYLKLFARDGNEIDAFSGIRPDKQSDLINDRLLAQIRYFGSRGDALPEWREAAKIGDAAELRRVWTSLPIMTKETLRKRFDPDEIKLRFGLRGKVDATGGSTGAPVRFFHDVGMLRAKRAASVYTRLRNGWRPGTGIIAIWGSERDIGKQTPFISRMRNQLARTYVVDGFRINRTTVERVLNLIERNHPVSLFGYSSLLEFTAEEVLALGRAPSPGWVQSAWNGGEMLLSKQQELFQRAFGVPLLNSYGGRELSVMACQFGEKSPLHVLRPWVMLEVIDEAGKPARPGEIGRVICTSTICRGTPFLRYEIGDLASYDACHCSESGVSALQELHGRLSGLLRLKNGRVISSIYWNHLLKGYPEVRQFQVVIGGDDTLNLLLTGSGFGQSREEALRATISGVTGSLPINIRWVTQISASREGKLIQVVRDQGQI